MSSTPDDGVESQTKKNKSRWWQALVVMVLMVISGLYLVYPKKTDEVIEMLKELTVFFTFQGRPQRFFLSNFACKKTFHQG